jgi:hypothetical protein
MGETRSSKEEKVYVQKVVVCVEGKGKKQYGDDAKRDAHYEIPLIPQIQF